MFSKVASELKSISRVKIAPEIGIWRLETQRILRCSVAVLGELALQQRDYTSCSKLPGCPYFSGGLNRGFTVRLS